MTDLALTLELLGNEVRLRMLALLSKGAFPECVLERQFDWASSAVREHLGMLRLARCVVEDGRSTCGCTMLRAARADELINYAYDVVPVVQSIAMAAPEAKSDLVQARARQAVGKCAGPRRDDPLTGLAQGIPAAR